MDITPERKVVKRRKRKRSIRRKVHGTAQRPRLTVYRSIRHLYGQVVDDDTGRTLVFRGTLSKETREKTKGLKKQEAAKVIGAAIAEACKAKGISSVVFDRNGFSFHGRVAAVAAAAREAGLKF